MAKDLKIRPLTAEDKTQWAEMWRDYLAFYETTLPYTIYERTFERLLGDDRQDFSGVLA